ncbi:hypothetical protein [Ensifer sp. ENS06]
MTKIIGHLVASAQRPNAVVLNAVQSTHGRPGFQTPDRLVISKTGTR